jgi:formamidopyrimidine-DNA glycosylase
MPEIVEVELTRRGLAPLIGDRVRRVVRTDPLVVGDGVDRAIAGTTFVGVRRRGKQLVLDVVGRRGGEVPIGVHLGMTGRVLLDEVSTIGTLAYGSRTDDERWDRWVLALASGVRFRLHDPRRLAKVTLDPDLESLGPDALALQRRDLAAALADRRAPVKAVLLDQHTIAGLGNMIVDEVLWWSAIDPHRPACSLTGDETAALHGAIRRRLPVMLRRGGSHTGTLSPDVRAGGQWCERDGAPLARGVVGGRATVWCPFHQR